MDQVVVAELQLFGISVLFGIFMAITYDVLRGARRAIHHSDFMIGMQDTIYWFIMAVLIFRLFYRFNSGAIRGYAIMGMLIGSGVYLSLFSKGILTLVTFLVTKFLYIFIPFRKMKKIIRKALKKVAKKYKIVSRPREKAQERPRTERAYYGKK